MSAGFTNRIQPSTIGIRSKTTSRKPVQRSIFPLLTSKSTQKDYHMLTPQLTNAPKHSPSNMLVQNRTLPQSNPFSSLVSKTKIFISQENSSQATLLLHLRPTMSTKNTWSFKTSTYLPTVQSTSMESTHPHSVVNLRVSVRVTTLFWNLSTQLHG